MSVEALVLSNRAVAGTDAFKRQSVTSERWLRLLEVGAADVAAFLQERRQAGYTIIGELCTYMYCTCKHNGAVLPLSAAPVGRRADGVDAMA
jgi:hypothetical protein